MRKTSFDGAVVVVTGAASGMGRAAAHQVVQRGGRVVVTDRNADDLAKLVDELPDGSVVHSKAFDVTDEAAITAFAAEVHQQVDAVDVLLNVAGISTWGRIQDLEAKHWRDCVEVDLMGPINLMSAFVPPMIEAGRGGHIANVSSAAGLFGLPWHAPYSAAKFGLRGVSEVLRFDLANHDIGVTLVCPGAIDTPLVRSVNIVGVDRDHPTVKKAVGVFQKHAVSPDKAAEAMLRGVEKGRAIAFTSADIRFGWYGQRYFPFGYDLVMRIANKRATAILSRAISR